MLRIVALVVAVAIGDEEAPAQSEALFQSAVRVMGGSHIHEEPAKSLDEGIDSIDLLSESDEVKSEEAILAAPEEPQLEGFALLRADLIWIWSLIWQTLTKWSGGSVMGEFRKDFLAWLTALVSFALTRSLLLPMITPAKKVVEDDETHEDQEAEAEAEAEDKIPETNPFANGGGALEIKLDVTNPVMIQRAREQLEEAEKRAEMIKSAQPEHRDVFGCTALHLAAHNCHLEDVVELLKRGFDVHAQEIIISDSALQGVLSSHNALAKKFLELQQGFDEWKKKEEDKGHSFKAEAAQQRALDEERRQQEAKAAEEQQQNMAERLKTLEDQVAEQGKTQETLKETLGKIPELEEKREQIEGLQKSIGEILKKEAPIWFGGAAVAGENAPLSCFFHRLDQCNELIARQCCPLGTLQEEMMSKVLPEWEVTSFKQGMEDRMAELEKTGNTRHEACAEAAEMALAEEFRAVEPRLTPLLDALKQRLDATDDNLAKLGESESTAENVASLEQLSAQLKASAEAAEAFANKQDCSAKESVEGQDELVVGDFKERFDGRLKDLEGALKQSEYVNLIFQDRFKTELAAAAEQLTDLYRARDLLNGDVAQLRTDAMAPLAPLQEAQQQLRGVTAKLEEGLAACQAKAAELAGSFATTAAQQSASQGSLKGRVEADLQRLETSARAETQHLLQMIRANEVAVEQLKQLEGQVVEERRERQELRERDRQAEIVTCQWMAEKRAQDVELGANSRFESVRHSAENGLTGVEG
ncbi:Ankyrin repeat domain-containing protein 2 [Durusdinium trenchii]|uniref:Ankyrin repeat domain-containing protein 2 n=1 Tax=Durusdinium trenchii TaxID=1381693 RepID=A0ABP0HWE0_9DINO